MTKLAYFAILPLALPTLLLAQGNYVANGSNNSATSTYGTFNTFVGPGAGASGQVTGNRNTVSGYNSGVSLTSGSENTFYGVDAGEYTTSGSDNTFLGRSAGLSNTTGYDNVFTGTYAGYANTTGYYNVFSGTYAGYANTTGSSNVFTGNSAGYSNTTGSSNVFIGATAGRRNTTGSSNVFTGTAAGDYNTTGYSNVFSGYFAGFSNTTGYSNVFSGYYAGNNNTTGSNNTFVGNQAGYNVTTGGNNIIIGPSSGTAITDGSDNVLMGYNSQAEEGIFNGIAIGSGSRVSSSNSLILGNGVNVGIGTSAPKTKLEVVADEDNASGLRLTHLTNRSNPTQLTDQFLTVNEKGDVVKARYQLRISSAHEWSDKVFSPRYRLRSLSDVSTYVQKNRHLPGLPSAEQIAQEGVELVQLNATLLEKVEELTLYSIQLEKTNEHQEARIDQLEKQHKQEMADLKKLVNQLLKKQ